MAWPHDAEAREVLEAYLDSFATAGDRHPTLSADLLDFSGADLSGLDLASAYLFNTILAGLNLVNTNLVKATLNGADLRGSNLTGADLYKAETDECSADGAVYRDADLIAVDFGRARLVQSDFRGARLNSVRLLRADLTRADLRGACLPHARFGADVMPTVLTGARMFGCDLVAADGVVIGPVDIGEHEPTLVDGAELLSWFAAQGAPNITLAFPQRRSSRRTAGGRRRMDVHGLAAGRRRPPGAGDVPRRFGSIRASPCRAWPPNCSTSAART